MALLRTDRHGPLFKISLLSIALLLSDVGAVSPTLSSLAARFPEQPQPAIQSFITAPAIAALVATLVAGALAPRVGKQRLVLLGIALIVVGGMSPLVLIPTDSYPLVLGVRLLAGFGMGLLQPLSASLISDFYSGRERVTLLGLQSSVVGAGNIVWGAIVTALMGFGWMHAYWVYAVAIVMFLLVLLFIPEPSPGTLPIADAPREDPAPAQDEPKQGLPRGTLVSVLLMFLMTISFQALGISLPFLAIDERHLATGAQVSLIMTNFGIASVAAGVVFGAVSRALKWSTGPIALLVLAGGMGTLLSAHTLSLLFVGATLIGLGFGTYMPFAISTITARATGRSSATVAALVFSGAALAGFLSPYYFQFASPLVGTTSASGQFTTAAVTLLLTAVAAIPYFRADARWADRTSTESAGSPAPTRV